MIKPAKITLVFGVVLSLAGITFAQLAHDGQFGRRKNSTTSSSSVSSSTGSDPAAAVDPGVQTAPRFTGASIIPSTLAQTDPYYAFFEDGLARFETIETVTDSENVGLGPRFNSNQCSSCHAFPATGGTGNLLNPQSSFIVDGVAPSNTLPSFIAPFGTSGPTREARFPFFFNSNGTVNTSAPNGGVEDLFTVTGSAGVPASCVLAQPPFAQAVATNNVIFRIPTPTFGLGLIENIDDSTLLQNQLVNNNNNLGISGTFNHNGNDGTISRFGWKAQNKSLQIFSGEAYNVEMGITNELFPTERPLPEEDQLGTGLPASCLNLGGNGYPEDEINPTAQPNFAVLDDVSEFANFMRFLAPPQTATALGIPVLSAAGTPVSDVGTGQTLFSQIGCATCHNPTPGTTQPSGFDSAPGTLPVYSVLSNVQVNAFSDIEIHDMGAGLADNVSQGSAGGDQFRTAPLWGLGQRIFLLHDGRTTNLLTAIEAHSSNGSEANTVIQNFNLLPATPATPGGPSQQAILDFLRSL